MYSPLAPTFATLIPERRLGRFAPSSFVLAFSVALLHQPSCFAFVFPFSVALLPLALRFALAFSVALLPLACTLHLHQRSRFAQHSTIIIKKNCPCRESNLHAEPLLDLKFIALTTRPRGKLCVLFKASHFFLAEYALRSQWVSEWVTVKL